MGREMFGQAFAHFPRQVQPSKTRVFLLQGFHDAQALAVVLESAVALHQPVQDGFTLVAKGGVAQIVCQRDGLGQIFIQTQRTSDITRYPGDFHRMS